MCKQTRKGLLAFAAILAISVSLPGVAQENGHSYLPKDGFVPTAEAAVKIAEAVWLPIYGESVLKKKPFHARLVKEVWIVEGTLPSDAVGGVPVIEISKKNGAILRVSHGK